MAIAYFPSYVNIILRVLGIDFPLQGPPSVLLWNWLAVVALLVFMRAIEGLGIDSIGLRPPGAADLKWALIFWGASAVASALLNALLPPAPNAGLAEVVGLPIPVLIALIVTTATTEEVLFRGYPIERLREFTGSVWFAALISFSLFVLPHLRYFGPTWLLYNGVGVVLFYVLYLWRRNLWACMLMHFLTNAPLLLVALGVVD